MFKCGSCRAQQAKGVKTTRLVVERRPKDYTRLDKNGQPVLIGRGWEIVRELLVCPPCADTNALNEVQ
jgi:uncharacterized protein YqkB